MTVDIAVIVCAGGASWELPLLRGLQRPELGIRVVRRCLDHGELLGTALRDRPRAVVLDAAFDWVDRDLVATLRRSGVEVVTVGDRDRADVGAVEVAADVDAAGLASVLEALGPMPPLGAAGEGATSGRLVVVWGGAGAPGRTTVAVHLAIDAARRGGSALLIDGDGWSASVAQLLELDESPSVAQAARLAAHGWPTPLADCLQSGPDGLAVLVGLPRAELWPEVRPEAWRAVLAAATEAFDTVIVDVAAPIEEDEELVADRVPFRRNLMTTTALDRADRLLLVTGADPIGLRRGVIAHRQLTERAGPGAAEPAVVLNRIPRSGRLAEDCSRSVESWVGTPPAALLPLEPTFARTVWEGRPIHVVAPRSAWLRELGGLTAPGGLVTAVAPAALAQIEADVRELLVRRELPLDEDHQLRALVDEVVADYRDRYLDGGLPPLAERDVDVLRQRILGFGALTPLIDDPEVEEIWVNEPDRVFVARNGEHELTGLVLDAREVEEIVERMLARAGRRLDRAQPFVDARLPDGSRLHVTIPPITDHWAVNVRKFVGLRAHSCSELVELGSCSPAAARFLDASVQAGLSIVVAGAVGAGKTTLLNCLLAAVPTRERIVTCEEVFELRVGRPDVVAMQCRQPNLEGEGAITLRDLVRESLRMRPDRIVVGEVRGAETLDMLLALNSGSAGMTSVHANSAREALRKLTTLPLLAGGNLDRRFVTATVAACVDLVVFCRRVGGVRQITEVVSVAEQVTDGDELTTGTVFAGSGPALRWTGEYPTATARYGEAGVDLRGLLG